MVFPTFFANASANLHPGLPAAQLGSLAQGAASHNMEMGETTKNSYGNIWKIYPTINMYVLCIINIYIYMYNINIYVYV